MKLIDWYIFKAISKMTLVVLFVFAALSGFVDFISQSDDIGIGEYGVYEAIQYTLLKLSLIHISEPTRQAELAYALLWFKKK